MARYSTTSPTTSQQKRSDFGASPTRISSGAPSRMPKLLPVIRLLAAGVSRLGSISRRSSTPELMVPVSMPYMEIRPS